MYQPLDPESFRKLVWVFTKDALFSSQVLGHRRGFLRIDRRCWNWLRRHVLIGTMLYCILMTGVFLDRAPTVVPAARGPSVGLFNQRPSEGRIILNANDQTSKSCRLVLSRE